MSVSVIKHTDSKKLGEKVISVHDSRVQSIIVGKSKQELQTASHVTSTVKGKEK